MRTPRISAVLTIVAVIVATASCGSNEAPQPLSDGAPRPGLKLVFADEFDGDTLDVQWSTCFWWQLDGGCTITSENPEQQWYRPEAVAVGGGVATLTASADMQATTDGDTLPYRSGMITTGPRDNAADAAGFAFTYGYVEARVRFPVGGTGVWPAVWLLSADRESLPEIDLMEWYGSRASLVTGHVHQRVDGDRASQRRELTVDDPSGEWHRVGLSWQEGRVEMFFDDVSMGPVDDADLVPSTPMYPIVNLAVGGRAGNVDAAELPQSFVVDWIRVWQ